jgi:hypothetical protein
VGGRQDSALDMTAAYATSVLFLRSESIAFEQKRKEYSKEYIGI